MANTKTTLLDSLVSEIHALDEVNLATRRLLSAVDQREAAPYVGVISSAEINLVEDDTHIRWLLDVDLILQVKGTKIEKFIDAMKDAIYAPISAAIGALDVTIAGTNEVALVQADEYSSTRMILEVTYVSAKAGF